MSYYTFFYPDKTKLPPKEKLVEQMNKCVKRLNRAEEMFTAAMIDAYYKSNATEADECIHQFYNEMIQCMTEKSKLNYDLMSVDEDNDGVAINYAEANSEYEIKSDIELNNKIKLDCYKHLLSLTRIRFVPDERYSDTAKIEGDYLLNEYQENISDIIESLDESCDDIAKDEFMLANFNTKKTENDIIKMKKRRK